MLYLVNRNPVQGQAAPMAGSMPASPATTETQALVETGAPIADPAATGFVYGGSGEYPGYAPPVYTPAPPRPPKARSYLGLATLSLALVTMGILGSLSLTGVATIPLVVTLAAGLAVLGVGLLVGTLFGRARWLMALAIPLLLVIALVALVPSNLRIPTQITGGERTWAPTTVLQASAPYDSRSVTQYST